MDNSAILKAIENAVKGITTPDSLGDSILTPEQFDQFVREIQESTTILQEARYQEMDREKLQIDRIAFMDRVLHGGGVNVELEEDDFAEPDTSTNELVAQELIGIVGLKDHTVKRNIERENLQNTIIELLGEAAGRDLEEFGIFANEDIDPSNYGATFIDMTNGWVQRAANKVFGEWDDSVDNYPENIFEDLLKGIPKKYLNDKAEWRFYVTWEIENAYKDLLKERGTPLGDSIQIEDVQLAYKGIPVRYAPMLERSDTPVAMLQYPDNMVWGVFEEVQIETEREAKLRRTDFVLTFEGDADYEDENAAIVAIDEEETDSDYTV